MLSKILLVLAELQVGFSAYPDYACTRRCGEVVGWVSVSSSQCLGCKWECDRPGSSWIYTGEYNFLGCGMSGNEELYCMRYSCHTASSPSPPIDYPDYQNGDDGNGGLLGATSGAGIIVLLAFIWWLRRRNRRTVGQPIDVAVEGRRESSLHGKPRPRRSHEASPGRREHCV